MPSPIIARADALMHRRRQSDNVLDDIPVLTDSVDPFDDIPVLTEVETALENEQQDASYVTVEPAEPETDILLEQTSPDEPCSDDGPDREQLINALASRIEDRIKAVLPDIISSTIREFLAEQEMSENA